MTAEDLILISIANAKAVQRVAKEELDKNDVNHPDYDFYIQIERDAHNFIQGQRHTLSLMK